MAHAHAHPEASPLSHSALHAGCTFTQEGNGWRLVIPAGVVLMEPLQIGISGMEAFTVTVGERARVTLHLASIAENAMPGCTIDIHVAAEARCECVLVLGGTARVIKQQGVVADGGSLQWRNVTLAAGEVVQVLRSELAGPHAESSVDWAFYARAGDKYTLSATNVFTHEDGGGEIFMKGVAQDTGAVSAKGMIDIGLQGGGTNTYLTQDVLMLDPTAKVDAVPGLEIKTNDVKASHSATVSRVTDEDLFYFAARGIGKTDARRMFIEGFLGDLVQRIGNPDLEERLLEAIGEKYGRL